MLDDHELIAKITEAVLAALAQRGVGEAGASAAPAAIHAPAGVCTGDYSKFPELAGTPAPAGSRAVVSPPKPAVAPPPALPPGVAPNGPAAGAAVLSGIVTAHRLEGLQGIIYLAKGARLSPLAQDLVKQRGLEVRQATGLPAKKSSPDWVYWMQGHCPSAARVVEQYQGRLIDTISGTSGEQLPAVIGWLSHNLAPGGAKLAVLFVPTAGQALVLANRCPNLRAVAATGLRSVREGIEQLGANVLVLEYPPHGFKAMAEMVELFLTSPGAAPASWPRQVAQALGSGCQVLGSAMERQKLQATPSLLTPNP